ncbi:siderophore ABC transporter substrate-binding protein [Paracoccus caeni]|uniref:Siderophore ABC transporter substrate-binding protein n=1 Tax=Paracoccus caeni TaxID=657651 RepID=A0A934SF52_9RHOB|nr:siderophore ABC transporter substrate-binding protein [Paracoccus caeni]MBK4214312.1 siderophore ABC transporter substrate-binding protein [Paracoccus caeni]
MIRLQRLMAFALVLTTLTAAIPARADDFAPITVTHSLGETVIGQRPLTVAALDMNELDFLDRLGVPVAGAPKDFVPHFLEKYRDDAAVADLGFIVKPNIEKVHALRPDLILITSLQAEHYAEMSRFAPVIHFDVDYRDSSADHIGIVRDHFLLLAQIFGKEDRAQQVLAEFDRKLADVQALTKDRPERALIVMHNNGAFSAFGTASRYGFVFDAFGVKPANPEGDSALHGQPVTSEFIQATNPDMIFVIDRTAVMERRDVIDVASLENPLLRETRAWQNGKVILVDPEAWYVTAASITPLEIVMEEVGEAYSD